MKDHEERHRERQALKDLLTPHLRGVDMDVIGAVLGELVAMYFTGHHPEIRDRVQDAFVEMVDRLVEVYSESKNCPWPKQDDVLN